MASLLNLVSHAFRTTRDGVFKDKDLYIKITPSKYTFSLDLKKESEIFPDQGMLAEDLLGLFSYAKEKMGEESTKTPQYFEKPHPIEISLNELGVMESYLGIRDFVLWKEYTRAQIVEFMKWKNINTVEFYGQEQAWRGIMMVKANKLYRFIQVSTDQANPRLAKFLCVYSNSLFE